MLLNRILIRNFKSIKALEVTEIGIALILVGKNNTGKSSIVDALKIFAKKREISPFDYNQPQKTIEIDLTFVYNQEDVARFYKSGLVSRHRKYEKWLQEFNERIPKPTEQHLCITCRINPEGEIRYGDGVNKDNDFIEELIPNFYIVDEQRNLEDIDHELMEVQGLDEFKLVRENVCIFDATRKCNGCFNCIGFINRKKPEELTLNETFKLVNYKMYTTNLKKYADNINRFFVKNYSDQFEIRYKFDYDLEKLLQIQTVTHNIENGLEGNIHVSSTSMKSLYVLSLFQAYLDTAESMNSIIIMEQPELHLHPELEKISSDILYKLSRKNQIIFTTHSPIMLFNFSERQICHVVLEKELGTQIKEKVSVDQILSYLGYNANDFMNTSFVFIVEGKDDRMRLPLLLNYYYSEIQDAYGNLKRITIIPTNSCTNIKTYANLKFINKTFLKDNFLMVRDSDGHDPVKLKQELCHYYYQRGIEDDANIPRIRPENVLILKYYSIENYFLEPSVMVAIGLIESEEAFYQTLFERHLRYLYKLKCAKNMETKAGLVIRTIEDLKNNMETYKIYMRGHNVFDIFYGRYHDRKEQMALLQKYIEHAPKEIFEDILSSIDHFIYFENRKKERDK